MRFGSTGSVPPRRLQGPYRFCASDSSPGCELCAAYAVCAVATEPDITSTILVLPDAQAASAALDGAKAELAGKVANGKTQPAAVGSGGTMLTGMSPDGSKSVTVLSFAEGNTATTLEFDGAAKDPAPSDLVLELGHKQDTAIRDRQAS